MRLIGRVVGRVTSKLTVPGRPEGIPFSNPTAIPVAVLWSAKLNGRLLESFVASGGITTVVRLLLKSTCPEVINNSATLVGRLLGSRTYLPQKPTRDAKDLADKCFLAGE